MLENYPKFYNDKLKDKLCKHFGKRLAFWQHRKKAELIYAADIEGEAAFELAASDDKRFTAIIRRHINEGKIEWTYVLAPICCFQARDDLQRVYWHFLSMSLLESLLDLLVPT